MKRLFINLQNCTFKYQEKTYGNKISFLRKQNRSNQIIVMMLCRSTRIQCLPLHLLFVFCLFYFVVIIVKGGGWSYNYFHVNVAQDEFEKKSRHNVVQVNNRSKQKLTIIHFMKIYLGVQCTRENERGLILDNFQTSTHLNLQSTMNCYNTRVW